jgi:lambda family phage portal protein
MNFTNQIKHFASAARRAITTRPRDTSMEDAFRAGRQIELQRNAGGGRMYWPGAEAGRTRGDWSSTSSTTTQNIRQDWARLVARSELATRTDAIAHRVVQVLRTFSVGSGLRPFPAVFDKNGEQIKDVNKKLRDDWERFNETGIRTGSKHMTVLDAQGLEFDSIVITGNSLVNIIPSRDRAWLPFAFQFIRPERLDFGMDNYTGNIYEEMPKNPIVHGILRDQTLDPVSFYIKGVKNPVSAKWMSIHFWQQEVEQLLGIPWMAPVLPNIWDNQQFRADKMYQARMLSRMGVWMDKGDRADILSALEMDGETSSDSYVPFDKGMMMSSSSKPEAIKLPDDLAEAYGNLVKMMILEVGIGMGFSYQLLTTDLEGMNFASTRQNKTADSKYFRYLTRSSARIICQPKYDRFVEWEIMTGKLPGVSYTDYLADPYRFNKVVWLSEGDDWVDPLKDAEAIKLMRDMGVYTFRDICALKGKTPEEVIAQLADEEADLEAAGLERFLPAGIGAKPEQSAAPAPNKKKKPEPVEDDLTGE